MYPNGSSSSYNASDLQGVIYPDSVFIIAPFTASLSGIVDNKDQTDASFPGSTFFTGDDAIALFQGFDTLDVVGVIGEDPGSSWSVSGTNSVMGATASYTLVRDSSVQEGQLDWGIGAASEWVVYPNNEDGYLGFHYMTECALATEERIASVSAHEKIPDDDYRINVYPNPVQEELRIDLHLNGEDTEEDVMVYVTNSAGYVVWESAVGEVLKADFSTFVDVSDWHTGLYMVIVKSAHFK